MGGGLIWRVSDDWNYYLARANPLEQNTRIYRAVTYLLDDLTFRRLE